MVKKVCIAVAVLTLGVLVLDRIFGFTGVAGLLVLSREATVQLGTPVAWLWQVVTHAFVHRPENVVGAAVGLLFLWLMGAPVEIRYGPRVLLKLLAVSVLAAGLAAVAVMVIPGPLGRGEVAGLSPMLVGLIAGLAATGPLSARVTFFVVPMTQRMVLIVVAVFVVLRAFAAVNYPIIFSDGAAGFAAYYYMRFLLTPRTKTKPKKRKSKPPRAFTVIEGGGKESDENVPKWLN